MMTRKDFEELAGLLKYNRAYSGNKQACDTLAAQTADFCQKQNPRFDRTKFLRAAGCREDV